MQRFLSGFSSFCLINRLPNINSFKTDCEFPPAMAPPPEIIDPCRPSPCGINAECRERNQAASCTCLPGLFGDPYVECKPECTINPDCPTTKACVRNKCVDPCPGVCGSRATCSVQSHSPVCRCDPGLIGDPFTACYPPPTSKNKRTACLVLSA